MEMNRPTIVTQAVTSSAIRSLVTFFVLRALLGAFHKPHAVLRQIGLAAAMSLLLVLPSFIREMAPLRDRVQAAR